MKQIAFPAALGCGALVGSGSPPLWAAEWSMTPVLSSSVDYDSNRRLEADAKDSGAGVLAADLTFKRALETADIFIEPRYAFRRFTDRTLGNGDDRSLNVGLDWLLERMSLNLTASIWDQSTLLSEVLETGIVTGNTHRRQGQAAGNWIWSQTERRQLITQLSYADVHYEGREASLLPGYRYPSGSVGERFIFSERGSFTVSTFGNELRSDSPGNSSHEYGLQAELIYAFTERTRLDASIGESSRLLAGTSGHGTDSSVSFTHELTGGRLSLNYTHNLVPYGVGFLVERQQFQAAATCFLTPYLDTTIAVLRIRNNRIAALLELDRRSYDSATMGLNWHMAETWTLGAQVATARTQPPNLAAGTVHQWRSVLTLTWSPLPQTLSR